MKHVLLFLLAISVNLVFAQKENTFNSVNDTNGTVTDIDGNVYPTVVIFDQEWMAANLRVTRYANGDPIAGGLNNTEWRTTTVGAFAVYPHDAQGAEGIGSEQEMVEAYGKLYNELAVTDERGLCPTGWHVPSNQQWVRLTNYIMMEHGASNEWDDPRGVGAQLRSCRQINSDLGGDCDTDEHPRWEADELIHGLDVFGFSALPGGMRGRLGSYYELGRTGTWRSTTNTTFWRSWYANGSISSGWNFARTGAAVRCVKDPEEEPIRYNLNLNADPEEAGTVEGGGAFVVYSETSIRVIAKDGWKFTGWTGDIQYVEDPDAWSTTVIIPSNDISITAIFEETAMPEIVHGEGLIDIDGNEYPSVIIGNQEWMAKNLRTTRYRNGDPITTGLSDAEWVDTELGAYAIYPHDEEEAAGIDSEQKMVEAYGKLYNVLAMEDTRELCPVGWYVPSRDDWKQLSDYLMDVYGWSNDWRDPNAIGSKLQSCRQVGSPLGGECDTNVHPRWSDEGEEYHGTDVFGFSALPAGERNRNGNFTGLGGYQMWAAPSETGPFRLQIHAWGGELWMSGSPAQNMVNGYSVRCFREFVAPETYNLNLEVNPPDGGNVSGAGAYEEGTEVTLTATPNEGWAFVNWTDGEEVLYADETYVFTMPAADVNLTANFAMVDYQLTVTIDPEGAGSVTGADTYNMGQEVTLEALPNEGWTFVNWTDGEEVLSADETYVFTMPAADVTLTANYSSTTSVAETNYSVPITIYPNPAQNHITIEGIEGKSTVEVFSIIGAKLMRLENQSGSIKLDVSNLENGLYIITVNAENGVVSSKVFIGR